METLRLPDYFKNKVRIFQVFGTIKIAKIEGSASIQEMHQRDNNFNSKGQSGNSGW